MSELNNISATNGNPFAVERTFTQAEQYGFLNAVYAVRAPFPPKRGRSSVKMSWLTLA